MERKDRPTSCSGGCGLRGKCADLRIRRRSRRHVEAGAELAGKTIGKWVSDKFQEAMGSEARLKEASDEEVKKTIDELKGAAGKDGVIEKHAEEIETALTSSMVEAGVTPTRATEIVETVKQEIVKLTL